VVRSRRAGLAKGPTTPRPTTPDTPARALRAPLNIHVRGACDEPRDRVADCANNVDRRPLSAPCTPSLILRASARLNVNKIDIDRLRGRGDTLLDIPEPREMQCAIELQFN
jgi:hypothetical protein